MRESVIEIQTAAESTSLTKTNTKSGRYFFVVMSFIFLLVAMIGFIPSYQDETAEFPIHWSAHIHGAIMSSWLLVFITQTLLAANAKLQLHRQLGLISVGLGIVVWISMGIASARALWGYNPPVDHFLFDVLVMQLYGMLLFGVFFTWGILVRKDRQSHKRLLYLSTLVLIQAAIDRMHWLPGLYSALVVRFIYLDAFLVALFIYDLVTLKSIHRISWMGTLITIVTQSMVVALWGSTSWHKFWYEFVNSFR